MDERERALDSVLRRITELREAYDRAHRDPSPSEHAYQRLHALLIDSGRAAILDPHLAEATTAFVGPEIDDPEKDPLLHFETTVSTRFGYDAKTALKHIRQATGRVQKRGATVDIRSTADLVGEVEGLHARARQDLAAAAKSRWRKKHKIRRAVKTVDAGLYAIGTLVADGLHPPAFSLSHTVAMGLLSDVREMIGLDQNRER